MTTTTAATLASPTDVIRLCRWSKVLSLDLETTGLSPRKDRIRLLSVSDGQQSLVMDCFEHPIQSVLPALQRVPLVVAHHAAFDLGFLWNAGLTELPPTTCTWLNAELLEAGTGNPNNLAACCKRYLGQELDKELQQSDWSGPLTADQIEYSRRDAEVLIPLLNVQLLGLYKANLLNLSSYRPGYGSPAQIEMDALPAFVWMSQAGVPFDQPSWVALEQAAQAKAASLEDEMNRIAPPRGAPGLFGAVEAWNWNSPAQVKEIFTALGLTIRNTDDAALAQLKHPLARLLREHRHQAQLVKMYGSNWIGAATIEDGRVYPNWKQIGAATGRTTCKAPNLQQLPREAEYRKCIAAKKGKVLIKADYSQLQLRIAAKQSGDKRMLGVYQRNGDIHTETAIALTGKQEPTKADRQIAKSANFGLLFGMQAEGLRVYAKATFGVDFTLEEATKHRDNFFKAYPGLAAWHSTAKKRFPHYAVGATGRRRKLFENTPDTERLNSPVQADEADGTKASMGLLWRRRHECPGAVPVLFCHDEIVIECPAEQAEQARLWLETAMKDGMREILDPVLVEVEAKIKKTWGD